MSDEPKVTGGGPAFPVHESHDAHVHHGMTLRDWFAGQALAGMTSVAIDLGSFASEAEFRKRVAEKTKATCECAYEYADAMLEARKGGTAP